MAKTPYQKTQGPQGPQGPQYPTLQDFTPNCQRGIAVFTDGLNLNLGNIHRGQLTSAEWHANPRRIAVGDCFVVYHRTGPKPLYPATIYTGTITAIVPLGNGRNRYEADNVTSADIQGVNWIQFSGASRSIRYF